MTAEVFGVLIVDDEPNIRSGLAKGLSGEATLLATAANADEALSDVQHVALRGGARRRTAE